MAPAIKAVSELHQEIAWRQLSASEYTFDPDNRKVVVSLKPGEALLIEQCNLVDGPVDDAHQAAKFSIEEIDIMGNDGEIKLQGDQARRSFLSGSKREYTLTYR